MYMHVYVYMYMYMHVYVYMYMYMHVYVYVCISAGIYMYNVTHRRRLPVGILYSRDSLTLFEMEIPNYRCHHMWVDNRSRKSKH